MHDNGGKTKLFCNTFTKAYQNQRIFKNNHIKTGHGGHKDYKCECCGKSFSEAKSLKKHIHTIHEGHRYKKCESCGKSFYDAGYLKKHIHTFHEGNKDHKCVSCGRSSAQAGSLKKHIYAIHKGHNWITNVNLVGNHFLKQEF